MSGDGGFWAGRRALVTGTAGLLGAWVARALAGAGAGVVGLDLVGPSGGALIPADGVVLVEGDVRDGALLDRILGGLDVDTVIHLAAESSVGRADRDPAAAFEANVRGTWTVLEACLRAPEVRRVLVASSDKAYGDAGGRPYEESMPLRARHPYAVSKACADLIAQTYACSYGVPVAVSRCANLYGGGDRNWDRIVPGTIRTALEGRRPLIRSDGAHVRDYLYVEDAVAGVLALTRAVGERPELRGEAFNFSAEEPMSVLELVGRILALMGSRLEPEVRNEAVNEIREQRVNAARARTVLGWAPARSMEEGLARTIAWYRDYLRAAS